MELPTAVQIIDAFIEEASARNASDIHLQPQSEDLLVRFRIDGELYTAHTTSLHSYREILARLKILSSVRIDEHQAPQDGHFTYRLSNNTKIDIRSAFIPTVYGEKVSLRLFLANKKLITLSDLGCSPEQEAQIQSYLEKDGGLILVVGPTGSGKTSTLYALLRILSKRNASVITIEDPVEHPLPEIAQTTVNVHTGFSFEQGLRGILRQDPNIIGIGEIRDVETARIALQAALTGHLVISTIHATNAHTTIPRLINMGVEPYLISSALKLVISQRLEQTELGRTGTFELLTADSFSYV